MFFFFPQVSLKPGVARSLLLTQFDQGVDNARRFACLVGSQPLAKVALEPPSCVVDDQQAVNDATGLPLVAPEELSCHTDLRLVKSLSVTGTSHQFGSTVHVAISPRRLQQVQHLANEAWFEVWNSNSTES